MLTGMVGSRSSIRRFGRRIEQELKSTSAPAPSPERSLRSGEGWGGDGLACSGPEKLDKKEVVLRGDYDWLLPERFKLSWGDISQS